MGVFDGLRVVEFATGMAGPMAGMVLADYGAEVIKVEAPRGDWARETEAAGFQMWNRGKKSVVLDLTDAADLKRARALAETCDVLIEDLGAALPECLSFAALHAVNPALVHCTIRPFSIDTLDRKYPGYEGIVAARSGRFRGLDSMSGSEAAYATERPVFVASSVGSYSSAMLAVMGISGALMQRERTGEGISVDTSVLDGLGGATMRLPYKREGDKIIPAVEHRKQNMMWRGILLTFMTAKCSDGRYILMCARTDKHFKNWLLATGLTAEAADPRFSKAPLNFQSEADFIELEQKLRSAMATKTRDEWMTIFRGENEVGADLVLTPSEFMRYPQMLATERVVEVTSPTVGKTLQLGPIARMSETPSNIGVPAPSIGQHQAFLDQLASMPRQRSASKPSTGAAKTLPFAGITILELATYFATPFSATLLAENGARVIKVEPIAGDEFRRVGLEFVHLVHGKESIGIDLKSESGRAVLQELIKMADVVLTNYRRGPAKRLGIDYETVKKLNPKALFVYGASYGSVGPDADRPAFHSSPHALSGGAILQAGEGNSPVDDSYGDPCGSMGAIAGISMGLLARERYGKSQYVETTMLCSTAYVHSTDLVDYEGRPPRRVVDSEQHGFGPLYRLYKCRQGWLFVAAVQDKEWVALATVLGRREWIEKAEFATRELRAKNSAALTALIAAELQKKSAAEWDDLFTKGHVPVTMADESGQFEEFLLDNGLVEPATHPKLGDYFRTRPRVRFSSAPNRRGPACQLGEHTRALLKEAGYPGQEIEALIAAGTVVAAGSP